MLKNFKPVSFILLVGALCLPKDMYAELVPAKQSTSVSQQNGKVTGTVEDDFGPVAGASVVVKGTTNGNITDMDGNFTLDGVKSGDIIQISFIGYTTQEIKYTGQPAIQVKLVEDAQKLDEVVVTALGLKRETKALGYAVTELKGDDIKSANTINPVAALQGKVAGVEISNSDGGLFGGTKIQIRGASTLSGNNQPIYVVDGVILDNSTSGNETLDWGQGGDNNANDYGNDLKNLNPDDFESVSVLKGAAATALYGSRGLNGAVVITTKSGKNSTGLGISVSQTLGIDHAFKTPDIQTTYGPGWGPGWRDTDNNGSIWDPYQFTVNSDGKHSLIGTTDFGFGPKYDNSDILNYDNTSTKYSPIKNNMLDMYKLGFNTNTNVAVHGGNEKTTFYTSLSYKKATSTTENNTFERYSMMAKATHKLNDRVDIGASISFANSKPRNAQLNVGEYFVDANGSVWNPLYSPSYFKDKYAGEHGGIADTQYGDKYGSVPNNLYWFKINNYDYTRKETAIRPQMEVNIKILDWLRFKADANMNYYYTRVEDKQLGHGYANDGGKYTMSQDTKEQFTVGGTFTANKQFNDFSVGGFARFEYFNDYRTNYKVYTDGGMVVPGQWFVDNSKNPKKSEAGIGYNKRIISAVFAANVSWKNQLFLDITGRNDWSSALVYANRTGNHSFFYPSVSGSWLINETFELPEWISLAKLRGSWAQVGNDTDPYTVNQAYGFGTMEMYDGNIYVNTLDKKMKVSDLKPERKNAWEIGADFRVLNNRIHLDATYYKENTKNQIMTIDVPGISGVNQQLINAGNIQNQGVEIALNTIPFKNKDWQWDLDLTWTKNISKIVSLHPNVADYITLSGYTNSYDYHIGSVAKVGGAYGVLMSDVTIATNDKGEQLLNWDDTHRGAYHAQSKKVEEVGKMTPDFLGSLATTVRWKDLSLRIGLDARFGGMIASYSNLYGTYGGWTGTSMQYRDAANGGMSWTSQYGDSKGINYEDGVIPNGVFAPGTTATLVDGSKMDVSGLSYAQLVNEGKLEPTHAGTYYIREYGWAQHTINDTWVHELSYIALREIAVNYRLPGTIASKFGAKSLNVSFSARNLGYIYNSLPNNLNPESVRGNKSSEFRIRGYEPYVANYMFTVNAEF